MNTQQQLAKTYNEFLKLCCRLNVSPIKGGAGAGGSVLGNSIGEFEVEDGVIVNAHVKSTAAIAYSKLAALTASKALVSDGDGKIVVSSVTAAQLAYVDATSSIQNQLNSKSLELIAPYKAADDSESSKAFTVSLDMLNTYSAIIIEYSLHNRATTFGDIELRLNQNATDYVNRGFRYDGTAITNFTGVTTGALIASGSMSIFSTSVCGRVIIRRRRSGGANTKGFAISSDAQGDLGGTSRAAEINSSALYIDTETITEIKILANGGIWEDNSTIAIYGERL